jgi:predicted permease
MVVASGSLRQSLRSLRHAPWYSITIIGVIALSMALSTTVFAIVDGVLFRPLPYPDASALYALGGTTANREVLPGSSGGALSRGDVREFESAVPEARFALYGGGVGRADSIGDVRSWIPVPAEVDERFLDVLGVRPLLGGFSLEDFQPAPGLAIPALITYGVWQSHFGGRLDVLGETLQQYTGDMGPLVRWRVAGVLPRDFLFPRGTPNLVTPLVVAPGRTDARVYGAIVRVPAGFDARNLEARLSLIVSRRTVDTPARASGGRAAWDRAVVSPLGSFMTGRQRPTFLRVFGAIAVLVLLGCINICGLMASRGIDRHRELALRRALGAGTGHVLSMVFRENAILVAAGTSLGLAACPVLLSIVVPLIPSHLALLKPPTLDARLMGFAIVAMATTTVITSAWTVFHGSRHAPARILAASRLSVTPARSARWRALAGAQIGLGLVLTLTGGLIVGSLITIWRTDVGFPAEDLLIVSAETAREMSPQARDMEIAGYLGSVRRIRGVMAAGVTRSATILRRTVSSGPFPDADTYPVSPGFFDALGVTVLDGRLPTDPELERRDPVVVLSPEAARQYFGEDRPVGQEIVPSDGSRPVRVIGVVRETRLNGWDFTGQGGEVYTAFAATSPSFSVLIRVRSRAEGVFGDVLQLSSDRDARIRVRRAAWAAELLADTIKPRQLWAWLFGGSALAALVIVGVGVVGLISMATARRAREVGIRMSLGATRHSIVTLIVRGVIPPLAAGVIAGALGTAWTVQLLRSYTYTSLSVFDARVWVTSVAVVVVTAGLGAVIPALRASRTDPVRTLRAE